MSPEDFEPSEPMQNFQIAVLKSHGAAGCICETLREGLLEVIAHLTFEHHMRKDPKSSAATESRHVGAGLRHAEIVAKGANLNVILSRCQRHEPTCEEHE